jgi:hypothetical protein
MWMKTVLATAGLLAALGTGAGVAHADDVQCHVSPGGALWCQDMDTGQSWQASNYGDYSYQPSYCSQPYVTSVLCGG